MQIIESPTVYDAIIVGSGAGGGMATKILADAGLKVALVEAGPFFDPKDPKTMTQLKFPWESPRRGASSTRAFGDFDMSWGDWEVEGEPYTTKDDTKFMWWRARMLGGRTNHWGRISLRFGPRDFKRKNEDGLGENWPIGYDDVKPYYDRLDKMVGVFGSKICQCQEFLIQKIGMSNLIICFDNDEAGKLGRISALDKMKYLFNASLLEFPSKYNDVDDLGVDGINEIIKPQIQGKF